MPISRSVRTLAFSGAAGCHAPRSVTVSDAGAKFCPRRAPRSALLPPLANRLSTVVADPKPGRKARRLEGAHSAVPIEVRDRLCDVPMRHGGSRHTIGPIGSRRGPRQARRPRITEPHWTVGNDAEL